MPIESTLVNEIVFPIPLKNGLDSNGCPTIVLRHVVLISSFSATIPDGGGEGYAVVVEQDMWRPGAGGNKSSTKSTQLS